MSPPDKHSDVIRQRRADISAVGQGRQKMTEGGGLLMTCGNTKMYKMEKELREIYYQRISYMYVFE